MKKKQNNKKIRESVPDLSVNLAGIRMKNPVMVASGTFGYGEEYSELVDLDKLGAIVTKTITLKPRAGNPPPRTCETPSGIMNSIGLENAGLYRFLKEKLPQLKEITEVPVIVSIGGKDLSEYRALAGELDRVKGISGIEMNISCPNVEHPGSRKAGRKLVSQDTEETYRFVKAVRSRVHGPLVVKLTPNVTDIREIALAAKRAGADALSLINTLTGMVVDIEKRRPVFHKGVAGLSGPAIRPVGIRMVWECFKSVKLPIIGMGGVMDTEDALQYMLSGATAVAVGTGNFINPGCAVDIIKGIEMYLLKHRMNSVVRLIGGIE